MLYCGPLAPIPLTFNAPTQVQPHIQLYCTSLVHIVLVDSVIYCLFIAFISYKDSGEVCGIIQNSIWR